MTLSSRALLITGMLIFVGAFLLRYEYIMHTEIINPIRADAEQYLTYGYNLFKHGVYSKQDAGQGIDLKPDSFRSPGYPAFIAACLFMGGEKHFYPLLLFFQTFLGSIVAVLTLRLALNALSKRWAITASVLVAFSPHLVAMCGYMLTETLFSFLIILSLLFYIEAHCQKKFVLLLISSIFWGFAYLTNETVLFIPYCLAIISGIFLWKKGTSVDINPGWLVVFVLLFSVFPGSWAARNHMVVPADAQQASSRALNTMTHGSYIDFIYETEKYKYFPYYEDPMQPAISESFPKFLEVMRKRVMERPMEYLIWYLVKKPYYLWSWDILQGQGDIYVYPVEKSLYTQYQSVDAIRVFFKLIHPVLMFFFLFGLVKMAGKAIFSKNIDHLQLSFAAVVWIPVYYTLLYMVFAPWPRYALPLRPLFFIISIFAISGFLEFCKTRLARQQPPTVEQ